jgi:hypothetical protein
LFALGTNIPLFVDLVKVFFMLHGKDFSSVMARAKEAFNAKTDSALAECLGMKVTAYNNRKKSGSIPYEELIEAAVSRNVDVSWLLTGILTQPPAVIAEEGVEYRVVTKKQAAILDILGDLDDKSVNYVQDVAENQKQFQEMKEELAELKKKA